MPTEVFKVVVSASTTTTARPNVSRFFFKTTAEVPGKTLTINDTQFFDDNGDPVGAGGIVTAATNNGYYNLFVNGIAMQEDTYTVSTTSVVITTDENMGLAQNTPIVLVVTNFDPESTTTITG
jgi:hypothetical protein